MLAWPDGNSTLITSTYQLIELRRVLAYDRLGNRISPEQSAAFFENVDVRALVFDDLGNVALSPDAQDNPILATAIAGRANRIISGDKSHMLTFSEVEDVSIVTAGDALNRLGITQL